MKVITFSIILLNTLALKHDYNKFKLININYLYFKIP